MILHVSTWLLSKLAQKETWGVFYENSLCTFATTSLLVQVLWMCVSFLLQWFTCPVYLDLVSAAPIEIWKEKIWKDGEYRWFSQNNLMPHLGYFCFADRVHFSWVVPHCSTNWTQQHFLLILKSRLPARTYCRLLLQQLSCSLISKASDCHREWADAILARYFDAWAFASPPEFVFFHHLSRRAHF